MNIIYSNKYITRGLTVIIFLILAIYFTLFHFLLDSGTLVKSLLTEISYSTEQENWDRARYLVDELKAQYRKYEYLIMLNYAEAEYLAFEQSIFRIDRAISQQEKYETLRSVSDALIIWNQFGKIVPKP